MLATTTIEVLDSVKLLTAIPLEALDADIAKLEEQLALLKTLRAVRAVLLAREEYEPTTDLDARLKAEESTVKRSAAGLLPDIERYLFAHSPCTVTQLFAKFGITSQGIGILLRNAKTVYQLPGGGAFQLTDQRMRELRAEQRGVVIATD